MFKSLIIIFISILLFSACNDQITKTLTEGGCISDENGDCIIFDSNGIGLGVISKPNDLPDSDDYYILTTYQLFGKWHYFSDRIPLFGLYPNRQFTKCAYITYIDTSHNELKIILQSSIGSLHSYEAIYYIDTTKKMITKIKSLQQNTLSYQEIAKDDYSYFQCTRICEKETAIMISDTMNLYDFFLGFEDKKDDNCFDCPLRYSIDECLEMKKNNIPFQWEED